MNSLAKIGAICKTCGETLMDVTGEPTNCTPCENKFIETTGEGQNTGDEQRDFMTMISNPYLTAGCVMVAEQFVHREKKLWPEDKDEFIEEAAELLRYHAPIAYAYFFDNHVGEKALPSGTVDIILDLIWQQPSSATFLGGKHSGIILPGQS